MALDFLSDALGLASAGAGIAGLLGASGGKLHGWQERALKQGALGNQQISSMLMQGEQNPQFAGLVGQEEQNVRSGAQSGIRELLLQDQRQKARGLSGILNPERRDEGIASATATAFEQARQEARNRVRTYLQSAANVNSSLYGGVPSQPLGATGMNPQMMGLAGAFDVGRTLLSGQSSQAPGMAPSVNLNFGTGQMGGYGWGGLPIGRG